MRSQSLKQCVLVLGIVFMVGMISATAIAESFTMKIGIVTRNDPLHIYMQVFKEKIEARTGGRIKADIFPSAQLGSTPRLIEGTQMGTMEMVLLPTGFFKGVSPAFQVLDSPGLFEGMAHAQATCSDPEFREPFLNIAAAKGLVGVSLWVYGPTAYASHTPWRTLNDFKGKKIRVMATKVETGLMTSIGATGVPMPFSEITPGLQRKVIDGVRSNIVVLAGIKLFSVVKNINQANDAMIVPIAMVSKMFLDKLPQDLRQAVLETGVEMEDHMFKVAQEYNAKAAQIWRDQGAEVISLSTAERNLLMEKGATIANEVLGGGKATRELYQTLKRVAEKHRTQ